MEILVIVLLVGLFVLFIFIYKRISEIKNQNSDKVLLEWLKTTQSSISSNSTQMVTTLQENSRQLNARLERAAEIMQHVGREVGQMNEIGRSMKELQEFLKSPKLRGNIGEQVLKDLISQVFPKNSFHLQYEFKSGERVDAAIRTDAGILPIDSKFPMENFQKFCKADSDEERQIFKREFGRDVKRHIDAIAKKYILPDEGTMDFALLYVPSESVFYEIVNMDELLNYARDKRVYIVSPSTLYAHLQTILLSFEGKKIEEQSKEVFRLLRALKLDFEKVQASMDVLGKHIGNSSSQYSNVQKGFSGIEQKLDSVKHLG
jgi:DNA recombination protein RmuC